MTLTPQTATNAQKFIDISSNNFDSGKTINFDALRRAGFEWLFCKRTEGTGYTFFDAAGIIDNWHRLGGKVGHYHWLRPDSNPVAQADTFLAALYAGGKPAEGDKAMTDFEATFGVNDPGDLARAGQLRDFNRIVVRKRPPTIDELLIYTGNWYLERFGSAVLAETKRHRVVISEYDGAAHPDNRFGLNLAAYQYTDRAIVAGVSAPVDCNVWLIDPTPTPTDLLEEIMALNRNSADYKALIADIGDEVRTELDKGVRGPFGNFWSFFDLAATSRLKLASIQRKGAKGAKK